MNATEDGTEPIGEAPEISTPVRCHSRSYAGHRCTEPAGHDGPHGIWPARDAAGITDTLDVIEHAGVTGFLSECDKVLATKQLAERQTKALSKVRGLCENHVSHGQGNGAAPTKADAIRAQVADEILRAIDEAGA